jgi:hypothetical protein
LELVKAGKFHLAELDSEKKRRGAKEKRRYWRPVSPLGTP